MDSNSNRCGRCYFAAPVFMRKKGTGKRGQTPYIKYVEEYRLDKWVHNKTIQKARESFRITKEQKEYLKTLRVK